MDVVGTLDRFQRRHRWVGLPLAVIYKFNDDQGNYLAAGMTYYAFVAVFPLLLLATSILGFLLQGDSAIQHWALNSTLTSFPIVGDQLGRPEGLQGSVAGVVIGGIVATYGALGLGQSIQNAMHQVWAVPRNKRPNPILLRVRSLVLLIFAGIALFGITSVSVIGRETTILGQDVGPLLRWTISLLDTALIALVLAFLSRLAAAHRLTWKQAAPGALLTALLWQLLQLVSTAYVARVAHTASSMNKTFGLVLGIIGVTYLAAVCAILGMQLNVVVTRRLFPRSLLTPFTDDVRLTPGDQRAYTQYATMQALKGFSEVTIDFEDEHLERSDAAAKEPTEDEPARTPETRSGS